MHLGACESGNAERGDRTWKPRIRCEKTFLNKGKIKEASQPSVGPPSCRRRQGPPHQHHSWPGGTRRRRAPWQTGEGMALLRGLRNRQESEIATMEMKLTQFNI